MTSSSSRHHVRVIVSIIAERSGRILLIREKRRSRWTVAEPVGHLDPREGILAAATREFQEETGFRVRIRNIVGIYHNIYSSSRVSDSLRIAFSGNVIGRSKKIETRTHVFWVSRVDVHRMAGRLTHPTSRRALRDYLAGRRFPLHVLREMRLEASARPPM